MSATPLKICRKCHLELPETDFTITDSARGYRKSWCKPCENARVRAYYAENPEYRRKTKERAEAWNKANSDKESRKATFRKSELKRKYGLSPSEYDRLLFSQNGVCALCGCKEHGHRNKIGPTRYWPIDHDHKTGHVRGLLCHNCNISLGTYEDLIEKIGEDAIKAYLTRPCPVIPDEKPEKREARRVDVLPPRYAPKKPCKVEGCQNESAGRGYCQKHYVRLRRTGEVGGAENLPHTSAKGSNHHLSKLTAEDVRYIRASTETGAALAKKFGVANTQITNIRKRKTWKHVTEVIPHGEEDEIQAPP